jgi:hypothetical protein
MYSLEEIASNKPLTREENIDLFNGKKQRPTCGCLRAVETNDHKDCLFCFVQCDEQHEILAAREKLKKQ